MKFGFLAAIGRVVSVESVSSCVPEFAMNESNALSKKGYGTIGILSHDWVSDE